jgi:hypothetical protein
MRFGEMCGKKKMNMRRTIRVVLGDTKSKKKYLKEKLDRRVVDEIKEGHRLNWRLYEHIKS